MIPLSLLLSLVLAPSLASGAIFPSGSQVKMVDPKGFKQAMKQNRTSLVAFVAPWCGHCKSMAPEYSKAAAGLAPLIPVYAVDCDAEKNKRLCAEQGVQGFPTVKLFPRGNKLPPQSYDSGPRSASGFFYFATRGIPDELTKIRKVEGLSDWLHSKKNSHRILLLNKSNKIPLLWRVLANQYPKVMAFGNIRDKNFAVSSALGFEGRDKNKNKIAIYPENAREPILFEGVMNYKTLTKFLDSVVDGTADLKTANKAAAEEDEEELDEDEAALEAEREKVAMEMAHGEMSAMMGDMKGVPNPHAGTDGKKKGKKKASSTKGSTHAKTDAANPKPVEEDLEDGQQPNTAQKPMATPKSEFDDTEGAVDDETIPEHIEL